MGKTIYIKTICSHNPCNGAFHFIERYMTAGARGLFLSTSQFESNYFASLLGKKRGQRNSLNFDCRSFNSFFNDFPETAMQEIKYSLELTEKHALIYACGAERQKGFQNFSLACRLAATISELKSMTKEPAGFNLSQLSPMAQYSLNVIDSYKRRLEEIGAIDYETKVHTLSSDRSFYEYIKNKYPLIVFNNIERLSPIEIKTAAIMAAAAQQIYFITGKNSYETNARFGVYQKITDTLKRHGINAIEETVEFVKPPFENAVTVKDGLKFKTSPTKKDYFELIEGAGPNDEIEKIAREIKYILLAKKVKPSSIGIYIANLSDYRKIIDSEFKRYGLNYQTNEGVSIFSHRDAAPAAAFFDFFKKPGTESFINILLNFDIENFKNFKRPETINVIRNLIKRHKTFDNLHGEQSMPGDDVIGGEDVRAPLQEAKLRPAINAFKSAFLSSFKSSYINFASFSEDLLLFMQKSAITLKTQRHKDIFDQVIFQFKNSAEKFKIINCHMSRAECIALMCDLINSIYLPASVDGREIFADPDKNDRIMIHSKTNINLFNFDYIFISGLIEGKNPGLSGNSPSFFSAGDRNLLGMEPLPRAIELERNFFHSIIANASQKVYLSYPLTSGNKENIKSRFLDEIDGVSPCPEKKDILCRSDFANFITRYTPEEELYKISDFYGVENEKVDKIKKDIIRAAAAINDRTEKLYSPDILECSKISIPYILKHLPRAGEDSLRLSATRLERFFFCPASYFFHYLMRLKPLDIYTSELDPANEGMIIHKTLQRFFDQKTMIESFKAYYQSSETGRTALGEKIEEELLGIGLKTLDDFEIKEKYGKAYYDMKKYQYFNALYGYRNPKRSMNDSIPGYFKIFIDDYLQFLTRQAFAIIPLASELNAITSIGLAENKISLKTVCDRIDYYYDEKKRRLYFIIIDYKTGTVPSGIAIKTFQKIQAPLYIYAMRKYIEDNRELFEKITGDTIDSAIGAGFIYTSISRFNAKGVCEKKFFVDEKYKAKKNQEECQTDDFALRFSQKAFKDCESLIEQTPDISLDFLEKTRRAAFHMSFIEGHDCSFCNFKTICHRSVSAEKSNALLYGAQKNEILTNRRRIV